MKRGRAQTASEEDDERALDAHLVLQDGKREVAFPFERLWLETLRGALGRGRLVPHGHHQRRRAYVGREVELRAEREQPRAALRPVRPSLFEAGADWRRAELALLLVPVDVAYERVERVQQVLVAVRAERVLERHARAGAHASARTRLDQHAHDLLVAVDARVVEQREAREERRVLALDREWRVQNPSARFGVHLLELVRRRQQLAHGGGGACENGVAQQRHAALGAELVVELAAPAQRRTKLHRVHRRRLVHRRKRRAAQESLGRRCEKKARLEPALVGVVGEERLHLAFDARAHHVKHLRPVSLVGEFTFGRVQEHSVVARHQLGRALG
eukprot:6185855-Pleurochrysis_carterae.AAC.1